MMTQKTEIAILAGGCFWCIEAAFNSVKGVQSAVSGYMGGDIKNPTYQQISTGNTGHAEVVKIEYDPTLISYREILAIFFSIHDPSQIDRQGHDVGSQYRSAIFYTDETQKIAALKIIEEMELDHVWANKIVTQVCAQKTFYAAESYHQNYFNKEPENRYCQVIISPKLAKFKKTFAEKLK